MRISVVVASALLGAAALVGTPTHASASAPDPYSGTIETDCRISVPAVVEPGERVVVTIRVVANQTSPTPPTGEVDIAIKTRPGGDTVWTKTVAYSGGVQKVVGPVLDKNRNYSATSRFRPDDATFAGCRAAVAFQVGNTGGNNPPGGQGPQDGTLPDTGGPAFLWLLLGVGLVGGGTGTVVYNRRRKTPATV